MGFQTLKKLVLGAFFGVIVAILPLLPASAATPSLTTSPISTSLNIAPGESGSTTLQVENNSTQAISIAVELDTFQANGTSGQAQITAIPSNSSAASWVHFSQTTFTAEPNVWTPVEMTINLPASAKLGYYYAVLFKPLLPVKKTPNTNNFVVSNAVLILVDTGSNNEVRRLEVTNFTATKSVYEYLPVTFDVTVRNDGNIYLPPAGDIYISKDANFTKTLATLQINSAGGRVLPNSSRVFSEGWDQGFPVFQTERIDGQPLTKKNGQAVEKLVWNFSNVNKLRFGKYYARLVLVYSNGQRDIPIYGTLSFWVIPWEILLLGLIIILIPIGLLVMGLRYRHMYRKNRQSRGKD